MPDQNYTDMAGSQKDFVFEEFKSQIEAEGMEIDSVDETGLIYISVDDLTLKVSLDNVRKNYKRDKDVNHITDLVQILKSYSVSLPENWTDAKGNIYISLFPSDYDFGDFPHTRITDEFSKVYVHVGETKETWIAENDLKQWNITENDLENQANNNADRLLKETIINADTIDGHKLGIIEVARASLKGALLFAPGMKIKVKEDFGFPFYAVIPVRDFAYIFSEEDMEFFVQRLGQIVVDEYNNSGYPVTTEVLKFTEEGVEAIGKYPVD